MATRCERGAYYDESGICGCGVGHEDPEMQADDIARALGAIVPHSCVVPRCTRPGCGKALEEDGHTAECLSYWRAAASAS